MLVATLLITVVVEVMPPSLDIKLILAPAGWEWLAKFKEEKRGLIIKNEFINTRDTLRVLKIN